MGVVVANLICLRGLTHAHRELRSEQRSLWNIERNMKDKDNTVINSNGLSTSAVLDESVTIHKGKFLYYVDKYLFNK